MIPNSEFKVLNTLGLRIQKVELWARGHKSENGAERTQERTRAHIRAAGGRDPACLPRDAFARCARQARHAHGASCAVRATPAEKAHGASAARGQTGREGYRQRRGYGHADGPGDLCAILATAHGPTIQLDNNLLCRLHSSALRLGWSHFRNGQAFCKAHRTTVRAL